MFLHGFPEAAFVWDELLEHFARPENGGYRCVAPNLRGFEQSTQPADVKDYRAKHLVQDIAALIEFEGAPLECLVAHDWGGAVAWNLANQLPRLTKKLAIVNSPHPGTFLRELQSNPEQQAASAYMNFLIRPDAEQLLREDGYRRLLGFFTRWGGAPWLTEAVKDQYREVWDASLTGGLNYYRASPLRPPREGDPAAAPSRCRAKCSPSACRRWCSGGWRRRIAAGAGRRASMTTSRSSRWRKSTARRTGSSTSGRRSWRRGWHVSWAAPRADASQ